MSHDCVKNTWEWDGCEEEIRSPIECDSDIDSLCNKSGEIFGACYAAKYYKMDLPECVDLLCYMRKNMILSESLWDFTDDQLPGKGNDFDQY